METKIEKELINKIVHAKTESMQSKENNDIINIAQLQINEILSPEANVNTYSMHYDQPESSIKTAQKSKSKKIRLYNEKLGHYSYLSHRDNKSIIHRNSHISIRLKDNEIMSKIKPHINKEEQSLGPNYQSEDNWLHLFYKYCDSYRDIQVCNSNIEIREEIMKVYLFHILNHLCKRKEEIEVNDVINKIVNSKRNIFQKELFISHEDEFITQYSNDNKKNPDSLDDNDYFKLFRMIIKDKYNKDDADDVDIKDHGYTSPKILILVPYKKHAKVILDELIQILFQGDLKGINNKKKYKEEYGEFDSFDDCFRMGISYNFFQSKLNLYSSFDQSDIIIASPLGLKLASPGTETNNPDAEIKNNKVFDFLSSIEILLVDFTEVFLYQNLEHIEEILSFLNKPPKNNQNIVDINRIKENYINNYGKSLRQSIIISHFKSLDIELLIKEHCKNLEGRYIIDYDYPNQIDQARKMFEEQYPNDPSQSYKIKFEFKILHGLKGENAYDDKYHYFTNNIWQNLYESFDKHTIIFVASTFDYLRLKSFFKQTSKSVCMISEETDKKDWQRNRKFFEEGKYKFLLYSERAHRFKKINLIFAKNIFFYSLPEDPLTFKEMIELIDPIKYSNAIAKNKIETDNNLYQPFGSVISLVSLLEKYNLEKIIGKAANQIFKEKLEYYAV